MLEHKHLYSIKPSLKYSLKDYFMYLRKQWQYLYLIPQVLHFLSLCLHLHLILWIPSERLLTRFDNELAINLVLSINCNMYKIFFGTCSPFWSILVTSFSIENVKVIYFSKFSPKQVNCYLNSSANSFMIKL